MLAHLDRKANAFDVNLLRACFLNTSFLVFLILELAVVQNAAYRGDRFRGYFDQVEATFMRHSDRFLDGKLAEHFTSVVDHAYDGGENLFVGTKLQTLFFLLLAAAAAMVDAHREKRVTGMGQPNGMPVLCTTLRYAQDRFVVHLEPRKELFIFLRKDSCILFHPFFSKCLKLFFKEFLKESHRLTAFRADAF